MLHHLDPPFSSSSAVVVAVASRHSPHLHGGDDGDRVPTPPFVEGVGGEEPDDAELAGAEADEVAAAAEPLLGRAEVLPHTARPVRRRGEVGGAERRRPVGAGEAEPQVAARDELGLAGERQLPVALSPPGLPLGVERVGAGAGAGALGVVQTPRLGSSREQGRTEATPSSAGAVVVQMPAPTTARAVTREPGRGRPMPSSA